MTLYLVCHFDDLVYIGFDQQFVLIGPPAASHHEHLDVFLYGLLLLQLAGGHLLSLHFRLLHPQIDEDGVE